MLVLSNNYSGHLKWLAYPEHHAGGLWVPSRKKTPTRKNQLATALAADESVGALPRGCASVQLVRQC